MRKTLNNKLLMFWAVLEVLAKFKKVWASINGFASIQKEFDTTVGAIKKTSNASGVKTGEVTKNKNQALTSFTELLFKVTSLISVYATVKNDATLKNKVDYTEGELKDMRPGELLGISEEVLEIAQTHKNELVNIGLTDADIEAINGFIKNFESITSATRTTITARKTAGGLLNPQFTAASFILKEKLDNLMEQFRVSDSEFYNEYWNARETMNYGTRHEKEEKKAG